MDEYFGELVPNDIIANAEALNDEQSMVIGDDHNSNINLWNKVTKSENVWRFDKWIITLIDLFINLWYSLL